MRKIFTLLCCMLFAAQYSLVSAQKTTMQIWKDGNVTKFYETDAVDSVTFKIDKSRTINGHKFVDLGLPSGLLWAETNIGAETAADDGNYYAWAETMPQESKSYSSSSYKYGDNSKYYNDGKTELDMEDDAAYANWGSPCRIPTNAEFNELFQYCTWSLASMTNSAGSSISGCIVTSIVNGNSIFFPASGLYGNGSLGQYGEQGQYWSSTILPYFAYLMIFDTYKVRQQYTIGYRSDGRTVRPVAEP